MPATMIEQPVVTTEVKLPEGLPQEIIDKGFTMDESLLSGDEGGQQKIVDAQPTVVKEEKESVVKPPVTTDKKEATPKKEADEITLENKTEDKVAEKKEVVVKKEEKKGIESILKAPVTTSTEKKEEGKVTIPTVTLTDKSKEEFDYTKYSPQEQTNLKNMSRQSRDFAARLIDENKQLSPLKDSTYLQHQDAYVLSPDYKKLQTDIQYASIEGQIWQQQLELIVSGKPFKDVIGWNQDGSPKMGTERTATHSDEERVRMNTYNCNQVINQIRGQLSNYPQQFKQRITQDLQAIEQEQKARFAWQADPKMQEWTVNVEGVGDKSIKDLRATFKSLFPVYLQSSKGVDVAADMFVAMQIQAAQLREALSGKEVAQIKQEEVARGEPKLGDSSGSGNQPINGVTEFSMESFPESLR